MCINSAPMMAATVVAVDVGKTTAALPVTDAGRRRLLGPIDFAMTAVSVSAVLDRVCGVLPAAAVKVGWRLPGFITGRCWRRGRGRRAELSTARVSEQRRVLGRRRVKTDAIDLEAITELLLAGHGGACDGSDCRSHRADRVGAARSRATSSTGVFPPR